MNVIGARDRIVQTAYDLFVAQGVRAVGVDRIVAESGVTKTTLYRHFRSKDELVLAVLDLREDLWTEQWLKQEVRRRAGTPAEQLMAIFDAFGDWFEKDDYEGCLFTNSVLEFRDGSVLAAGIAKRANVRSFLRQLATEAGVRDPDAFAFQMLTLMTGAIVLTSEGYAGMSDLAAEMARLLLRETLEGPEIAA